MSLRMCACTFKNHIYYIFAAHSPPPSSPGQLVAHRLLHLRGLRHDALQCRFGWGKKQNKNKSIRKHTQKHTFVFPISCVCFFLLLLSFLLTYFFRTVFSSFFFYDYIHTHTHTHTHTHLGPLLFFSSFCSS